MVPPGLMVRREREVVASVAPVALATMPQQMGWTAEVAVVVVPAQRLVTVRVVTAARVLSSFVTRERAKRH